MRTVRSTKSAVTAILVASGLAGAAILPAAALGVQYTGCITASGSDDDSPGGSIIRVRVGTTPLKPCGRKQTLITWNSVGPAGPQGAIGPQGPAGAVGAPGPQGAPGANGTNGTNGAQGATGAQGAPGTNGTNGLDGVPGAPGTPGTNGTNGSNGTNGAPGAQGAVGPSNAYSASATATVSGVSSNTLTITAVPAGIYVVVGHMSIATGGNNRNGSCSINGGASGLWSLGNNASLTVAVTTALTLSTAGDLTLTCTSSGSTTFRPASLTAIKVGALN
jgi:Collagen triple helix repeat (20 copies)